MTNAEKEASALARDFLDEAARAEGYADWLESGWDNPSGKWRQRILRFAREYGPEIARQETIRDSAGNEYPLLRFLRGETLSPSDSPVEDTTPPGWTRHVMGPGVVGYSPPERGKPF